MLTVLYYQKKATIIYQYENQRKIQENSVDKIGKFDLLFKFEISNALYANCSI